MIGRSDFAYAQARIQARHGDRPSRATWQRLHASRELGHLLEAARATSMGPWLSQIGGRSDTHEVERALRRVARGYTEEIAGWVPERWRAAVEWTARLPDLPLLERLLGPEPPPSFVADDPALAPFALAAREERARAMREVGLGPVVDAVAEGKSARAGWCARFRELWPREPGRREALDALVSAVEAHAARMDDPEADGWALRDALEDRLSRIFRWHALEPVAIWAHLALVALDLERLRGAIVRRLLFPGIGMEASWV